MINVYIIYIKQCQTEIYINIIDYLYNGNLLRYNMTKLSTCIRQTYIIYYIFEWIFDK